MTGWFVRTSMMTLCHLGFGADTSVRATGVQFAPSCCGREAIATFAVRRKVPAIKKKERHEAAKFHRPIFAFLLRLPNWGIIPMDVRLT